jgi:Na+/proline symporter
MGTLSLLVLAYILASIGIGLYASVRVRNSKDFVLAGQSLPIYVTIATVFATWFGSEAILGIPSTFIDEGLHGIVSDPFGAGMCLIFVGFFFAARLYRMKLVTIGDFYRQRYSRLVEVLVSIAICISYLGWVAAQIVALGLVITIVTQGYISFELGMLIGIFSVIVYTAIGGMWAVAITDFFQMIVILIGLCAVAYAVSGRFEGGAMEVITHAANNGKFSFWPEWNLAAVLSFIGAFLTLALGSIPQQDVFQRVMSAKDEKTAVSGTVIGGSFYIIFCFIPIFIVCGAVLLDPQLLEVHMVEGGNYQRILPEFIMNEMPLAIQVLFFGALMSAIMSTASGTLLAPSAILSENILKDFLKLGDRQLLLALRLSVLGFGIIVFGYAYLSASAGLTIFEMVENAYLVTLCGAFVPLAAGVYWKKANTTGALISIAFGVITWSVLEYTNLRSVAAGGGAFLVPPQLAGLFMAIVGMVLGTLLAQFQENKSQGVWNMAK